jgi:hypothetical protein
MKNELNNMTIGNTKVIAGQAATRWSETKYEVGTWGRETVTIEEAIETLGGAQSATSYEAFLIWHNEATERLQEGEAIAEPSQKFFEHWKSVQTQSRAHEDMMAVAG